MPIVRDPVVAEQRDVDRRARRRTERKHALDAGAAHVDGKRRPGHVAGDEVDGLHHGAGHARRAGLAEHVDRGRDLLDRSRAPARRAASPRARGSRACARADRRCRAVSRSARARTGCRRGVPFSPLRTLIGIFMRSRSVRPLGVGVMARQAAGHGGHEHVVQGAARPRGRRRACRRAAPRGRRDAAPCAIAPQRAHRLGDRPHQSHHRLQRLDQPRLRRHRMAGKARQRRAPTAAAARRPRLMAVDARCITASPSWNNSPCRALVLFVGAVSASSTGARRRIARALDQALGHAHHARRRRSSRGGA